MEIYVLRHGIAEDRALSGRDSDRALTGEGRKRLKQVLQLAAHAGVKPELILTSPYVRAVQTARIAAEVLGAGGDLLETSALVPDSRPERVWDEVRTHRDAAAILLAGHEPLLSELVATLLASPSLAIEMKKGALVRIDVAQFGPAPRGVLKWMLVPKLAAER